MWKRGNTNSSPLLYSFSPKERNTEQNKINLRNICEVYSPEAENPSQGRARFHASPPCSKDQCGSSWTQYITSGYQKKLQTISKWKRKIQPQFRETEKTPGPIMAGVVRIIRPGIWNSCDLYVPGWLKQTACKNTWATCAERGESYGRIKKKC